jgi:hypothetical protein
VSEQHTPANHDHSDATAKGRKPPLLVLLAGILLVECILLAAAGVYLLIELLTATPDSYPSAIAILLLTVLAAVWLGVTAVHTLHGSSWIRGSAAVWQLLQIAVAVGSFQGLFARADVGWLLLIPAILALVLLFTPSVVAATARPSR